MMAAMIERELERSRAPLGHGAFVAVVGPSGAGKDTIIDYARVALAEESGFHFVRRVVTRPSAVDAEDHDSLSEEAFLAARRAGAFCHSWHAHGLHYGLPISTNNEIEQGAVAIANVSRGVLPSLRAAYTNFLVVQITASPEVLAHRLAARGRENAQEIERRLKRAAPNPCDPEGAVAIDNSTSVEDAGNAFVTILRRSAAALAICEQI